jgi:hypothetical protein
MPDFPLQSIPEDELFEFCAELMNSGEFTDWFGDSVVRDGQGRPMLCYHGTVHDFDVLDPAMCGGGIHFGSLMQANNRLFGSDLDNPPRRSGARLIPAFIRAARPKRMKEQDSWSESQLVSAADRGFDSIVYLNRREGLPFSRFCELRDNGWMTGFGWPKIQKLSDTAFLELVPEAQDSYIVFEADQILPLERAMEMAGRPRHGW